MRISSIRFRAETAKILEEKYNEHIKIYTNGSKKDEKVGCAVITPDQKFRKRLKPQNTVNSAEQEASEWPSITDSLSTLKAVNGNINSKNPKTLSLRKLLNEERKSPFSGCQAIWEYQEIESQMKKQKLPWKTSLYPQKNTHHKIWLTGSKQKTRKQDKQHGKIAKTI
jgi:hypothetical protein